MPELDPNAPVVDPPADPPAPQSLEDLLSDLPEDTRKIITGEVGKARNEAKGLRDRLKVAEPKAREFDAAVEASKTETDREKAAREAAEARAAASDARVVKSEVKALAAQTFADPEDAHAFLDLTDYVDDKGDVDTQRIEADLKNLLAKKPHLARGDGRHAPRPDPSQGSSGTRPTPGPREEFANLIRGQTGTR